MDAKIIAAFVILLAAGIAFVGIAKAYTDSDTITATVTVPAICTVNLSTNTINFNSVTPGTDTGSTNQQVTVTNGGNTPTTNTTIKGTNWDDGAGHTMAVGQTKWSTSSFDYSTSGTPLTTTDTAIPAGASLAAGSSFTLYFGVGVPNAQYPATYTQTITITMNC
ncbi:MAG: hypothetical protein J7K73_01730 [Nanoarchaeota archaeon]|nr:hypothetical protein [Nanoarchaeota archaeon]